VLSGRFDRTGSASVAGLARAGPVGRRVAPLLDDALLFGPLRLWQARRRPRGHGWLGSPVREQVYRELWAGAAHACGATLTDLGGSFYELARDGVVVRVMGQMTPLDDPVAMRLAGDKGVGLRLLAAAGVPVPDSLAFSLWDLSPAYEMLASGGRFVVKPAEGTAGGDGVTGGVRSREDLQRAAVRAGLFGEQLLLERQVEGLVHRLLVLDGQLLDVVVDRPAHLVGDGRSTVQELLDDENDKRVAARGQAGLELLALDLDLLLALRDSGVTLASVPPAGVEVRVRTVTNDRRPVDSRSCTSVVDDDVVRQAVAAVSTFGLRLAGVDVVAQRIDKPLHATDGVVLEVNAAPGLHRHYQVANPLQATRVADVLLELLLTEAAVSASRPSRGAGARPPQRPAVPHLRTAAGSSRR